MKIYNTLNKQIEEIQTVEPKKVKMYICGPTVYNSPTIANLRTYISQDVLRRALKYLGYEVNEVMNITDIEDKIIRDSKKAGFDPENKTDLKNFTDRYEKIFLENLKELNIEPVEHTPHATDPEVITKMVKIIEDLLEKGIAYVSEDGSVYFSISKYENYGKLSNLDKREVKAGARVSQDEYEKDNAQDFALWKATKPDEPSWEGPQGIVGRPGWHIECSAMSILNLGETIDIHGGGVDLIFPHHENEIAQSEAYTGKEFVKTWFHTGHLLINGQRMGKSLNNFYTLDDLKEKFNIEPLALRMLSLQSHYRDSLNFTEESIKAAQNTLNGLREFVLRQQSTARHSEHPQSVILSEVEESLKNLLIETKEKFIAYITDDLNTPKALAVVFDMIKEVNKLSITDKTILETLLDFDRVLGLELDKIGHEEMPEDIKKLYDEYLQARLNKSFIQSDKIRAELVEVGWMPEETKEGSRLIRIVK